MRETFRGREIRKICAIASQKGLLAGFSGNASIRLGRDRFIITKSGINKADLKKRDFVIMTIAGVIIWGYGRPSSEWRLHAMLYDRLPDCKAVLHTHPANMQALELAQVSGDLLELDLFEAEAWRKRLVYSRPAPPGSPEVAANAAEVATPGELPCAIWLPGHGLAASGVKLADALNITEELEHLAKVKLKYLAAKASH